MRIGLVSYRCENRNTAFNMGQIELAMKRSAGKADLLCFGETFLAADDVLMINPVDSHPRNHGGSFHFHRGKTVAALPFDREGILTVDIP